MWYNEGGNNALQNNVSRSAVLSARNRWGSFFVLWLSIVLSVYEFVVFVIFVLLGANWNERNEFFNISKNVENVGNVGKRHNS